LIPTQNGDLTVIQRWKSNPVIRDRLESLRVILDSAASYIKTYSGASEKRKQWLARGWALLTVYNVEAKFLELIEDVRHAENGLIQAVNLHAAVKTVDQNWDGVFLSAARRDNREDLQAVEIQLHTVNVENRQLRTALEDIKQLMVENMEKATKNVGSVAVVERNKVPEDHLRFLPYFIEPDRIEFEYEPNRRPPTRITLGAGGFGTVFRAKLRGSLQVAVKVVDAPTPETMQELRHELDVMIRLSHENVICVIGGFYPLDHSTEPPFIVMQLAENGSLARQLGFQKEKPSLSLSIKDLLSILSGVADGLCYLHAHKIVHRDLKPDNILLTRDLVAKLTDYGLSRIKITSASLMESRVGSSGYIAPEMIGFNIQYTRAIDIWSFGVIMFEVVCGGRMWSGVDPAQLDRQLCCGQLPWNKIRGKTDSWPQEYLELMKACLQLDDKMRPLASDVSSRMRIISQSYVQSSTNQTIYPVVGPGEATKDTPVSFVSVDSTDETSPNVSASGNSVKNNESVPKRVAGPVQPSRNEQAYPSLPAAPCIWNSGENSTTGLPRSAIFPFTAGGSSPPYSASPQDQKNSPNILWVSDPVGLKEKREGVANSKHPNPASAKQTAPASLQGNTQTLPKAIPVPTLGLRAMANTMTNPSTKRADGRASLPERLDNNVDTKKGSMPNDGSARVQSSPPDAKISSSGTCSTPSSESDASYASGEFSKMMLGSGSSGSLSHFESRNKSASPSEAELRALRAEASLQHDLNYYKRTATEGIAESQYRLGQIYETGEFGVGVDLAKARSWTQAAAKQNHVDAQCAMGRYYRYGIGAPINIGFALAFYKRAAERSHIPAYNGLGSCYEVESEPTWNLTEAFQCFMKAADAGDTEGIFNVGVSYMQGRGVSRDFAMAMKYFKSAAERNHPRALYNLAFVYHHGKGVDKDWTTALDYYNRAANLGHPASQAALASCYSSGKGVQRDLDRAYTLFLSAAKQGSPEGMVGVAQCLKKGHGVQVDEQASQSWMEKAAGCGSITAMMVLANAYYAQRNYAEALRWYRNAADRNHQDAMLVLASMYCRGVGVSQDYKEAFALYSKCAESSNPEAQYALGMMCKTGNPIVSRDLSKAKSWFTASAKQGHAKAQKELAALP